MCLFPEVRSTTMFRAVLVSLLLFALVQLPMRLRPAFHPDLMDGLRGAFLGAAIAALGVMSWRKRRGTPER
jgi:uncharacterized membrane protein YccC